MSSAVLPTMAHITTTTVISTLPSPPTPAATTTTAPTTRTTHSPFLDLLPPELRLRIYTHLLVAPDPLTGPHARRTTTYSLHTSILRVNRQVYLEARTVFFGKNTFRITSIPPAGLDTDSGAFEPPLQPKDLPLIRSLEVDMLYYAAGTLQTVPGPRLGWAPACKAAERYVSSVTHLLGFVRPSLLRLSFVADARVYATADTDGDADADDALDVKKLLTAFHVAEGNPRFNALLAQMPLVRHIPVSFLFPESFYAGTLRCGAGADAGAADSSLFLLACQVVLARSEVRVRALLETLEGGAGVEGVGEEEGIGGGGMADMTALAPRVALAWPSGDAVAVVQRAARALEMMK
jgi:hypothetical protein